MFITAMMWLLLILFSLLAIGFLFCVIFCAMGIWYQRNDPEMLIYFIIGTLMSAGLSTGFIFAAMAMWRNVA
jgi:hypothetical protein